MAVYGEHRPLDGSLPHELTSQSPFPSLKLYVLIGILSYFALSIALIIYLCVRLNRTSEKREKLAKETNSRASSGPSYEVFLSFRGVDTRHEFTDFLYRDMVEAGILVFRDNESLHVGKRIGHELLQAIENSKIYIPIFSKNYASSHWCLRELAYMVECTSKSNENKEILPIFLDVEPNDVKLKTDLYRKALSKYQKKFCTEVKSWKKALIEVDEIKGWNWKKDQGQGELIQSVIQTVWTKLNVGFKKNVTEHLVGVDDCVEAIIRMLHVESDSVQFLGIHGMGGIGKTTLAKVIYNRLSSHFRDCNFLSDIGESTRRHGLVHLQKQLLSKFLNSRPILDNILNVDDGINMIKKVLCNKKILIVLDNVDEKEQLKSLAEKCNWFGSGSRVIITTRDQSVLMTEGEAMGEGPVKKFANVLTYEVHAMEFDHALKLFSRQAFRRDSPPDRYISLSKEVVSTLGNLPLALEITGSSLNGKSEAIWVDTLKKLEEAPPMAVQKKLMISYERLDHAQKQVFLDIACFFVDQEKTYPLYMWDACKYCPHHSLEVLSLMSLIKIKDDNKFWMHDQVRDLGREIVHQENFNDPCEHSRVWRCEDALRILKGKEGSRKIEALSLGCYEDILTHEEFANLRNLRFLEVNSSSLVGDFNNLFSDLRWFSWRFCPQKFEVTNFHPANLLVLVLSSNSISEKWIGWNQIREARKLKVLDLSYCKYLYRTPNLSTWVYLERLVLKGCGNLIEIDHSIGKLKLLTSLNLDGCESLRELPEEIGCLQALTDFVMTAEWGHIISKRPSLKLPYSIGGLVKLMRLNLSGCKYIEELPDSVGKLQLLVKLDLSSTSIGHLPDSIGNLKQLKVLRMSNIRWKTKLQSMIVLEEKLEEHARECCNLSSEIPKIIGRLSRLRILDLLSTRICGLPTTVKSRRLDLPKRKLSKLPYSIGGQVKIRQLDLSRCMEIKELPDSIGGLVKITRLDLSGCMEIKELPDSIGELQSLIKLDLSLTSIGHLPDSIGNLKQLKVLRMYQIRGITELPRTIGLLEKLEELNARGCWDLTGEIPKEIGRLSRLRILNLSSTRICGLPTTVSHLSNLQTLELQNCVELKQLPEFPPSLPFLTWGRECFWCYPPDICVPSQQETPVITLPTSIVSLSQLITLELCCKNVQFLPQLSSSLRQLHLHHLATTRSPDFSNLKDLSFLTFYGCSLELSRIFDVESEYLRMDYCKFREVDTPLQLEMKRLGSLEMHNCMFLPEVFDLSRMKNLEHVSLRYCEQLVEICGLEELGSLCSLSVEFCFSLERMSDLSKLKKLPKLDIVGCWSLNKEEIYWNYWNGEFGGDIYNVGGFDLSSVPDEHRIDVFFGKSLMLPPSPSLPPLPSPPP